MSSDCDPKESYKNPLSEVLHLGIFALQAAGAGAKYHYQFHEAHIWKAYMCSTPQKL
jgi:hypothetical protein